MVTRFVKATAPSLLFVVFPYLSSAGTPYKTVRPTKLEDALRLDSACKDCFPKDKDACGEGVWASCCSQEIACHRYHCHDEVMGKMESNQKLRVIEDFVSDDDQQVELTKGMTGRVLRVDGQGDAYIKFFQDEFDDEGMRHWVYKTTFWEKLEPTGRPERLRASKTVDCLDNCSRAQECNMGSMTKKQQKEFQKCAKPCKLDACQADDKCKPLFQAYAQCKERVASSKVCNAPAQSSQEEQVEL